MSCNTLGNLNGDLWSDRRRLARMQRDSFRPVSDVYRMHDQEKQTPACRHPQKTPRNMYRDLLTPGTLCPLYEVQAILPPGTPRIARFTRFLISGTLYPLCCRGLAPWTASCAASSAVCWFAGFPSTAASAVFNRSGRAATPFTASRNR